MIRFLMKTRMNSSALLAVCSHRLNPNRKNNRVFRLRSALAIVMVTGVFLLASGFWSQSIACPFCSAVSQTLRQEMEVMDAVVIASATQSDATRNRTTGEVSMKIEKVLKGGQHIKVGDEVKAIYYGEIAIGRRFMLSGVDPPDLQWSCLPVTESSETYVVKVAELADQEPLDRLRFYDDFLQSDESMLARDAYDEFAIAPYDVMQKLGPEMDRDQLVAWISEPEMPTDRKRLFLTMLGVCGNEKDLPMLEEMLRSTKKSTRGGLDALIACYLTLSAEKGIPLINELFLNNNDAPYADTYAAIMAVRFHGTEGGVIPRSALVESLHHVLNRKDLADLVIPDLARWQDWSQIDRLTELFLKSDPDNNWVRVPVVNYLRACPLEKAKEAISKLEAVDPESVKRANTFFSIPVPAREATPNANDASSLTPPAELPIDTFAVDDSIESDFVQIDQAMPPTRLKLNDKLASVTAGISPAKAAGNLSAKMNIAVKTSPISRTAVIAAAPSNPLHLGSVIAMAIGTFMIAQFLLLTGGRAPVLADDSVAG